jgi:adenine-specific DNA-methyltransferase
MPPGRKRTAGPTPVEALTHDDKRVNIPTADARDFVDEAASTPGRLLYPRDTSLDPQLVWRGKDAQDAAGLAVEAPPIYIQRKSTRGCSSRTCDAPPRAEEEPELTLFEGFDGLDSWDAVVPVPAGRDLRQRELGCTHMLC